MQQATERANSSVSRSSVSSARDDTIGLPRIAPLHGLAELALAARDFVLQLSALPRAATGDSAVYWRAFARRGYPTFRFDLPGLGDSDGQTSTDLLEFITAVGLLRGCGHRKGIGDRAGYSGVVMVGHLCRCRHCKLRGCCIQKMQGHDPAGSVFSLAVAKRPETREMLSDWARRSVVEDLEQSLRSPEASSSVSSRKRSAGNANTKLLSK